MFKWIFGLGALAGLGVAGFESGEWLARQELRQARGEVARLTSAVETLKRENAQLRREAEMSRMRAAEMRQRYEREVPEGELRALLDLIEEQLAKGAEIERLRFLISAASREDKCDGEPLTKRFIARTPLHDGANDAVTFADGALTVTAEGESARDSRGRPQAWFDPAKPVTLEIAQIGEPPSRVSGKLPLQHAVVVGGDEYRLSAVAGERRGFIHVTADRCRFP